MKLIMIPVEGPIELVHRDTRVVTETFTLFGDAYHQEQVRFGMPGPIPVDPYTGSTPGSMVVMLCHDEGRWRGHAVNKRASVLYQGGRHNETIHGDVYLLMEVNRSWASIAPPWDQPGLWETTCAATEFRE